LLDGLFQILEFKADRSWLLLGLDILYHHGNLCGHVKSFLAREIMWIRVKQKI